MNFLSDKYKNMVKNLMSQASELEKFPDTINLSLGDPDITTDLKIIQLTFEDAKAGHTHYSKPFGDDELKAEIIKYYKSNYSCDINKNEIFISAGADHGTCLSLFSILNPNDEVIIIQPYYPAYISQIELAGGIPKIFKTSETEGFNVNINKLRDAISNKTKALIINYPNNPTGVCINKQKLEEIEELCKQKNIVMISDEVYSDFCYDNSFYPAAKLEKVKDRIITIGSFSKNYAMTGWRVGFVIASSYLIETIKEVNEGVCYSPCTISQRAALHALQTKNELQPQIVNKYRERVKYCYQRVNEISGISCIKPQGAIYVFVNIESTGLNSIDFAKQLYEKEHVLVIAGTAFGDLNGYVRIAATVGLGKLALAFERIEHFVENIK